jgi:hypothetical protein
MAIGEIKKPPLQEWLNCVNRYLRFCLERDSDSFGGIYWDELHRRGVNPIEAVLATVIETQSMESLAFDGATDEN